MIDIVITMAGLGSRFVKAGYKIPKYKIEVCHKTLFEWSMLSLKDFNDKDVKYIFINRKENDDAKFISAKCQEIGIKNYKIVEINALTDGQATTALVAKPYWNDGDELIIYNIDTFVEPGAIKYADIKGDGFIPCFKAAGDHWSFVRLDEQGQAVEVREKQRISDNCTIGLYYFKSCSLYEKMYNEYYENNKNLEKNERYIAPLYNHMIKNKYQVNICDIDVSKVHVLGTPEEVKYFKDHYENQEK